MKIKQKQNPEKLTPKFNYTVPQFKGLISAAFEPFLKGYAEAEEVKLKDSIDKFTNVTKIEIHGIFRIHRKL